MTLVTSKSVRSKKESRARIETIIEKKNILREKLNVTIIEKRNVPHLNMSLVTSKSVRSKKENRARIEAIIEKKNILREKLNVTIIEDRNVTIIEDRNVPHLNMSLITSKSVRSKKEKRVRFEATPTIIEKKTILRDKLNVTIIEDGNVPQITHKPLLSPMFKDLSVKDQREIVKELIIWALKCEFSVSDVEKVLESYHRKTVEVEVIQLSSQEQRVLRRILKLRSLPINWEAMHYGKARMMCFEILMWCLKRIYQSQDVHQIKVFLQLVKGGVQFMPRQFIGKEEGEQVIDIDNNYSQEQLNHEKQRIFKGICNLKGCSKKCNASGGTSVTCDTPLLVEEKPEWRLNCNISSTELFKRHHKEKRDWERLREEWGKVEATMRNNAKIQEPFRREMETLKYYSTKRHVKCGHIIRFSLSPELIKKQHFQAPL